MVKYEAITLPTYWITALSNYIDTIYCTCIFSLKECSPEQREVLCEFASYLLTGIFKLLKQCYHRPFIISYDLHPFTYW